MTDFAPTSTFETIDRADCLHLLRAHGLGRLAISLREQPMIFPVNYTMDGDRVVFRTDRGTKLHGAVGHAVAFEIDGFDRLYHEGWSVVVIGIADEVTDDGEIARLATLPLGPWAPGEHAHWVRVRTGAVTGRRITRSHATASSATLSAVAAPTLADLVSADPARHTVLSPVYGVASRSFGARPQVGEGCRAETSANPT